MTRAPQCGNFQQLFSQEITMIRIRQWRAAMFVACVALMTVCGVARAQEIPIVTGEHWTKSSEEAKKAYLVGIANMLQVENAYFGANPPPDTQSFVPRMSRGLKGSTLDGVQMKVTDWYAKNPDKLQRPVLEIVWFEMVVPGLK
jgi:hypothetical protein